MTPKLDAFVMAMWLSRSEERAETTRLKYRVMWQPVSHIF